MFVNANEKWKRTDSRIWEKAYELDLLTAEQFDEYVVPEDMTHTL